jgi:uncharacterized protein (DUF4415 family)
MNKHDKSMWGKVAAMPDSQAEANAMADPDNAPTDAMFWADVDMQEPDTSKVPIHIRVAPDVLEFFKKDGPGYQTRINRVLEQYVGWQQR